MQTERVNPFVHAIGTCFHATSIGLFTTETKTVPNRPTACRHSPSPLCLSHTQPLRSAYNRF
ncbi:MAG: hypothetical protein SPJ97_06790 [Bacteroides sp.]|nr:hypothetical protein [Bacteroides sp.]